jgi:hypothetical protein
MKIPKKISYEVPQGDYRARLAAVIEVAEVAKGRPEEGLRFVFVLTSLKHPRLEYRAGKNYALSELDKLGNDLDNWLGEDFVELLDADNEISTEKLKDLIGREVDVEIVLCSGGGAYKSPFRYIVRLLPPGALVDDTIAAA